MPGFKQAMASLNLNPLHSCWLDTLFYLCCKKDSRSKMSCSVMQPHLQSTGPTQKRNQRIASNIKQQPPPAPQYGYGSKLHQKTGGFSPCFHIRVPFGYHPRLPHRARPDRAAALIRADPRRAKPRSGCRIAGPGACSSASRARSARSPPRASRGAVGRRDGSGWGRFVRRARGVCGSEGP